MKSKLRQILYDMRTQPIIAWVTILGTALSIFLIMTVVMMQQISLISIAPETHRDRMLYGLHIHAQSINPEEKQNSSAPLNYHTARRLYEGLDGVEKIAYQKRDNDWVDARGTTGRQFSVARRQSDAGFFEVYDHTLLAGRYFTPEEVEANTRVALLDRSTARNLFGSNDVNAAVGQHFELDHNGFEVIGVVEDNTPIATMAYGQVFAPMDYDDNFGGNLAALFGPYCASLLLKPGASADDIRRQVKARYGELDAELAADGVRTVYHEGPYDQATLASGSTGSNVTPDASSGRTMRMIIYAILLIVPAINLSTMLHSRLRRRVSEIGVRRAFGCTRARVITDIITENLLVTVIGGIIGVLLAIIFAQFYDGLYTAINGTTVRPALSLLLNWRISLIAFGVCFILNIISASVPAWQASRVSPVEAINAK